MNCQPCKAEGRTQVAHRIVGNTPKCKYHYNGRPHPAARANSDIAQQQATQQKATEVEMPKAQTEIDWPTVAKKFQEGTSALKLGAQYGVSDYMVRKNLKALGLDTRRHRRSGAVGAGFPGPSGAGKPALAARSPLPPRTAEGDLAVRYRLVKRAEEMLAGGKAVCDLSFVDGDGSSDEKFTPTDQHRLQLRTAPAVSRQFQVGEEYLFTWEPAGHAAGRKEGSVR